MGHPAGRFEIPASQSIQMLGPFDRAWPKWQCVGFLTSGCANVNKQSLCDSLILDNEKPLFFYLPVFSINLERVSPRWILRGEETTIIPLFVPFEISKSMVNLIIKGKINKFMNVIIIKASLSKFGQIKIWQILAIPSIVMVTNVVFLGTALSVEPLNVAPFWNFGAAMSQEIPIKVCTNVIIQIDQFSDHFWSLKYEHTYLVPKIY